MRTHFRNYTNIISLSLSYIDISFVVNIKVEIHLPWDSIKNVDTDTSIIFIATQWSSREEDTEILARCWTPSVHLTSFLSVFTQCERVSECVCWEGLALRGFCKIQFIVSAVTGWAWQLPRIQDPGPQPPDGASLAAKCSNSQIKSRNKLTIVNKTN